MFINARDGCGLGHVASSASACLGRSGSSNSLASAAAGARAMSHTMSQTMSPTMSQTRMGCAEII